MNRGVADESDGRAYQQMVWFVPGDQRPLDGCARGGDVWLRWPERRGQDHYDAHDPRSLAPRRWRHHVEWRPGERGSPPRVRLSARRTRAVSADGDAGAVVISGPAEWDVARGCAEVA